MRGSDEQTTGMFSYLSSEQRVRLDHLLRVLLLQSLYTVRRERLLMEEIDCSALFRWLVGLGMDEPVWSPTTFSKNRD